MDLFDHGPDHPRRSNNADGGWWDQLTADSPLWSSEGSLAREHFPINDCGLRQDASQDPSDGAPGAGRDKARSSWVLVGSLRESAQELALTPLPDDVDTCVSEAEELMVARDRITSTLADRVGRVHRAGQAKRHGHASTRSWLRTAGGMSVAGAGRLLTVAVELARLPRVREAFAQGGLAAGVVEAICTATVQLNDEQAGLAEPILLELAGKAGPAEVAKAGRYLRAVLDPDGEERDEQADYARRFLRVRPGKGGGLEGEFYLPREAAARLRALLDAYAKPRAEGDDRPLSVRNADAFIALLEREIATELLVLVNAESLPTDPEPTEHPEDTGGCTPSDTGSTAHSGDNEDTVSSDADSPGGPGDLGTASTASAEGDNTAQATGGDCDRGAVQAGSIHARRASTCPAHGGSAHPHTAPPTAAPPTAAPANTAPANTAPANTAQPDPPPEDAPGHHTRAGHRPAGDCRHAQGTHEDHGDVRYGLLGTAPGLLLATGQMLPVSSVHRLARTSTLVRLVMDAEGQVLDMGRKVRLATPAQRRAVFARYATCWIDGCPVPATMCQIDHADNWSTGGLTDLKLLGPACQFHNRDRYRHPDRYTRHKIGTDRWAFTYHPAHITRLRV
ncbi:DUF222 domain-containing protein [Microbispora sp. NEAU-D428]|uniref:HNH endonuclease signature motif containing protein n=1 Tax=Microbispora sitophila TaxID=2771537 RepID=UPI0018676833|nr:HNH endonuclease signature motif containing protein [Microbispora sitophila]MBE3011808.1 DUF222 domain-containing protein [Microbispora sitophila]